MHADAVGLAVVSSARSDGDSAWIKGIHRALQSRTVRRTLHTMRAHTAQHAHAHAMVSPTRSRRRARAARPVARPAVPQYGDATFDAVVREVFDAGDEFVADPEQARVLWDDGWDFLDVRCDVEREFFGECPNPPKGTVGGVGEVVVVSGPEKVRVVPLVTATAYRYDSNAKAKVMQGQALNPSFVADVERYFPDKKQSKIIVVCSDGRLRAVKALEALEDAGYERLVLLRGGFNLWNRGWTSKLSRRIPHGEFISDYRKPGDVQQFSRGSSASNAGDAIEFGPWVDPNDWKPVLESAA